MNNRSKLGYRFLRAGEAGMKRVFGLLIAGLALWAGQGFAGEIQAKPATVVEKVSSLPYSQAIAKFEAAVKGARMIIVGEPNYQLMQRMVGRERKGAKGYFIFRPDLGTPIFDNDPKAALEIPLKVVFLEQPDGKVLIRYYKPSSLLANYNGLGSLGTDLDKLLDQITEAAMK